MRIEEPLAQKMSQQQARLFGAYRALLDSLGHAASRPIEGGVTIALRRLRNGSDQSVDRALVVLVRGEQSADHASTVSLRAAPRPFRRLYRWHLMTQSNFSARFYQL